MTPAEQLFEGRLAEQGSEATGGGAARLLGRFAFAAQAAESLGLSLPRYYQLEARGLQGLLTACESRPRGRQPAVGAEAQTLRKENAQLRRDLLRQQSLVRLDAADAGVSPPSPRRMRSGNASRWCGRCVAPRRCVRKPERCVPLPRARSEGTTRGRAPASAGHFKRSVSCADDDRRDRRWWISCGSDLARERVRWCCRPWRANCASGSV